MLCGLTEHQRMATGCIQHKHLWIYIDELKVQDWRMMEIPSVEDSEGHSASGSPTFAAQELNPEIPAPTEKEDHCDHDVPHLERSSLSGNDEEMQIQNRSTECVCQGNAESSQETEPVSLSSGEAAVEVRPAPSAGLHDEDMVSRHSCCLILALPVSAPEGRSDHADQNTAGQILSCEPNGYVRSLESSPPLAAHPNGPDAAQNFQPVPRIVNHKQSSITFSNCPGSPDAEGHRLGNGDSDNGEEKDVGHVHSVDDNDDNDDDVFSELPVGGELLIRKMKGARSLDATRNCGCEAEEEVCLLFIGITIECSECTIWKNVT